MVKHSLANLQQLDQVGGLIAYLCVYSLSVISPMQLIQVQSGVHLADLEVKTVNIVRQITDQKPTEVASVLSIETDL